MKRSIRLLLAGLFPLLILAGCGNFSFPVLNPSPTPTETATVTPSPFPTATPDLGKVVLVAPPEVLPERVMQVVEAIRPTVTEAGYIVETIGQIPTGSLGPNRIAAIFLSIPGNLVEIIAANPQTQMVVVSNVDLQTGPTLTVLREYPEYQAFIAGYAAVLASPGWRAAGLIPDDGGEVNVLANAFMSGGRYFCGRCGTSTPPFAPYPLTETAPRGATSVEWQAAVTNILPAGLETVYFSKEAQSNELLQNMLSQNLRLLGTTYPGDAFKDRWVATVSMNVDGSLVGILPDILKGQGGRVIPVGVQVTDINEAYLSAGKQRLIDEINKELMAGQLNPFTVTLY
ncbi:MAG: hypothetical protein GX577_07350 [Leptolinea sp.]|nr:hypothetical protein [Leptolinea sp.]